MPICAACGQPITTRAITALDRAWHPEHFVCAACGKPIGRASYYAHADKPYCKTCYVKRVGPCCAVNGHPIEAGRVLVKDGLRYCEMHYWERFGRRCAIGGEFLRGAYRVNAWGDAFCDQHAAGLPICYSCGRPVCERVTGGGVRYADGRMMCMRCRRTAVDDPATGQRVLDTVRAALTKAGLDTGHAPVPLRLADGPELARRAARPAAASPAGLVTQHVTTQSGRVIERRVDAVMILHGLPREHFEVIVAHELMHVHMFLHDFPELPGQVEEGLCELAEQFWLATRKPREAAYRLKLLEGNPDPTYGDGYRRARAAVEHMTFGALLEYVRRHGQWP